MTRSGRLITPQAWPLVIGCAMAFVAVAGGVMALTGGGGPAGWVIPALAAVSAVAAFAAWARLRRTTH